MKFSAIPIGLQPQSQRNPTHDDYKMTFGMFSIRAVRCFPDCFISSPPWLLIQIEGRDLFSWDDIKAINRAGMSKGGISDLHLYY